MVIRWKRVSKFVGILGILTILEVSSALPFHVPPCELTGYDKAFKDLTTKVSIIGQDDRGPLLTKGPKIGLSQDEIKQIRQVTGFISCPGPGGLKVVGSASLIGSNSQIITNAHNIKDDQGNFYEPLSECFFQNQDVPYQHVMLDIAGGKNLKIGTGYPDQNSSDYAIAKLKSPVKDARGRDVKPFPVDLSQTPLQQRQKMYLVSASQEDIHTNLDQPIIQACEVGDVEQEQSTVVYGTCDTKHGASGGVHLVRYANGQLVMKAIFSRLGLGEDGQEYSKEDHRYSYSVGIDGPVIDDLKEMYPALSVGHGAVGRDKGI